MKPQTDPRKHDPIHPGEILQEDFIIPLGITPYRMSKDIGVSAQHIGRVIHGKRGIGADLALRLARYLGTSAQLWMNLQAAYELDVAEDSHGKDIDQAVQPYQAA
jgi:addiction module HigA family antidote